MRMCSQSSAPAPAWNFWTYSIVFIIRTRSVLACMTFTRLVSPTKERSKPSCARLWRFSVPISYGSIRTVDSRQEAGQKFDWHLEIWWLLRQYCVHPLRLNRGRGQFSIPDLTRRLSNSWQRHSAYGYGPARSPLDHCMRKLRSKAATSGTRGRHPTHSSSNPVRMNYCRRSQREQVLMQWTLSVLARCMR